VTAALAAGMLLWSFFIGMMVKGVYDTYKESGCERSFLRWLWSLVSSS
jgi:hypothetical protein